MYYINRTTDDRPPPSWASLDLHSIGRHVPDFEFIAQHGDVEEFLLYVNGAMQQEFGEEMAATDAQDCHWRNRRSEGQELARLLLPAESQAVAGAFSWFDYRRRLKFKLAMIKREADRLRAERAKPKARASA
jgi:hypothetical protein